MNNATSSSFYEKGSALYDYVWDHRDKRMDNYFLMGSPMPTLILCCCYVMFSVYIGPWYMKNRKPYNIRNVIIVYNLVMVLGNGIGHILAWDMGWARGYNFRCEPVDFSNNPQAIWISQLAYLFYLSKFLDWLDTVFFIMRKKFNHVSALHVYHHCCMPINVWPIVRFVPGGHVTLGALLNTFVHTVMYAYYFFAALGPKWQKYLWWKKYITLIQILQFIIGLIHIPQALFVDCGFPRPFIYYFIPQGFLFLAMFGNFYRQAYLGKPVEIKEKKTE